MKMLANRIGLSLLVIVLLAFWWEFYLKPAAGPVYLEAQKQYKAGNYERSLELLRKAYYIDANDATTLALMGWNHLRLRNFEEAEQNFQRAVTLSPRHNDARLGLAHCSLELGKYENALDQFRQLPPDITNAPDQLVARARAHRHLGDNRVALDLLAQALDQDPDNQLARRELSFLTGSSDPAVLARVREMRAVRRATLGVAARLREGFFEVPRGDAWRQTYIAGVNLAPGVPGRFASDPPGEVETYRRWLNEIAALGANSLRLHTLLPPAFYRALLQHNQENPNQPLYLFQGIWLDDPPGGNLFDRAFTAGFRQAVHNVVDALHGQADLPTRPGHGGGLYTAEVSEFVLAWLVGRQLEPSLVIQTNRRNPGATRYQGTYLAIDDGTPAEVWLTQMCDSAVEYEVRQYNWQRPVAFVNGPSLDPLFHPTETPAAEERRIRRAWGEVTVPPVVGIPDDDDAVSLDEEKIRPQPDYQAGYFAFYQIYPFYPDFMINDPGYRRARDTEGLNSFWGYLQDLKRHYQRTPLLVGEYGLSTSPGIAHFNPIGWNHGGLEEADQAAGLVRLTRNIKDAGFAGGLVNEWVDQWWKQTWIAARFEQPYPRSTFWQNTLDPAEHFGLQKFTPAKPPEFVEVHRVPPGAAGAGPAAARIQSVAIAADAAALYITLGLDLPAGQEIDWNQINYTLGINTCGRPCGSRTLPLPGMSAALYENGFNFLVRLRGPEEAQLLVARNYYPYRAQPVSGQPQITDIVIIPGMTAGVADSVSLDEMVVQTNRRRYARDGTFFPAERYSRSVLIQGNFEPTHPSYNSLGQWYYDPQARALRLRLGWGLLLAMDPSTGNIFWQTDQNGWPAGTTSKQLILTAFAHRPAPQRVGDYQRVPDGGWQGASSVIALGWPAWERVEARQVPKKSYFLLQEEFGKLTGRAPQGR